MPTFIDTPKKEKNWNKSKKIVENQTGKSENDKDFPWALVNYIYHNINRSKKATDFGLIKKY